jgi:hypothetical protein
MPYMGSKTQEPVRIGQKNLESGFRIGQKAIPKKAKKSGISEEALDLLKKMKL